MGYDLHITRRKHWAAQGEPITAEEWLDLVRLDPELRLRSENGPYFAEWSGPCTLGQPWLDWSDGAIHTKNPDSALIDKMVAIGCRLGATVQGDDGEFYETGRQASRSPKFLFRDRIASWLKRLRPTQPLKVQLPALPFSSGDRVQDAWGNQYVVLEIDPEAEHGAGVIRARRDDGTEHKYMVIAHGLAPVGASSPRS